jgi:DNA segregation ATPase FtsK/SpoIIIE-like protein
MKIRSITPIEPEPARCIEVGSDRRLYSAGGIDGLSVVSHNSVAQRNIIFGCIMRPDSWFFLGIDLKKVELSSFRQYSHVVMGIATTLQDALTVLRFAQQTMMSRYAEMEELGKNNFLDLEGDKRALMVMVDEAGELLSPSGVKTDEGKAEDQLKGEATMIIGSIARLGRAAGVHIIVATQRPDAKIIPGEVKANLPVRVNCGRTDTNASLMILGTGEGLRVRSKPRGRMYVQSHGKGDHGQGFFAEQEWIDNWLDKQGLNVDGTPKDPSTVEATDDPDAMEDTQDQSEQNTPTEPRKSSKQQANDEEIARQVEAGERPALGGEDSSDKDKFHRPEDDWDEDMDELSSLNDD